MASPKALQVQVQALLTVLNLIKILKPDLIPLIDATIEQVKEVE